MNKSLLSYKGYSGKADFDDQAGLFHGEVIDLNDVITFQGTTVPELITSFRESVDDYLKFCEERGEEPERPFSGKLLLRMTPSIHKKVYIDATRAGKSINEFILDRLSG